MTNNAVVYVAWGHHDHVVKANRSLTSLYKHTPNVRSYLFTDDLSVNAPDFDNVFKVNTYPGYPQTKVGGILDSFATVPEDHVLYLDNDTRVIGDISDLFDIPKWFDIGVAHAPFRKQLPPAFPTLNSGVIVYNNNRPVMNFVVNWFEQMPGARADQFIMSKLLYFDSHLRFAVLPQEYNVRTGWPACVHGEVKILHGRQEVEQAAGVINEFENARRVWMPSKMGMVYK